MNLKCFRCKDKEVICGHQYPDTHYRKSEILAKFPMTVANWNIIRIMKGRDKMREVARIKFNRTCQNCGRKWKKNERRFDIHHLEGCGILTKKYDRLENLDNLICYCHSCHLNLESVRRKMRLAYEMRN